MLQTGYKMSPRRALGLVWLIYGFTTVCDASVGAKNNCYRRKTCDLKDYDSRDAVCCENTFHEGRDLSCCGKQAYNPAKATCCKGPQGHHITAGLSERVSACCGINAFNLLNEICCESSIVHKNAPKAECCGKEAFDVDKQLCCGKNRTILTRNSIHHLCCGHDQYDNLLQRCCVMNTALQIQPKNSTSCEEDSEARCGSKAFNKSTKHLPHAKCCGEKAYDEDSQLCCGKNQTILTRKSIHHLCCGHDQYDNLTQHCSVTNGALKIRSKGCEEDSDASEGVQQQKHEPQPNCTEPHASLCGSSCYNPHESRCCERKQTEPLCRSASGQCDAVPTLYNPRTHLCCDGRLSVRLPWIDKCCGETPYGLAQGGVLCCNGTLYKDREDGEECSDINIPHNPTKGTMCCSQFHRSPGQHCCGTEVYLPKSEICCDGQRNPKVENTHCCGVQAYDIKNPQLKCCAGTLHNLTLHGHDMQCCGSILHNQSDVCCSSEGKEVLYSNKTGFKCCGHLYYNPALWSCCAGKLSPVHHPGHHPGHHGKKESKLLSVNNLSDTDLCGEMQIGTVESVSLLSIVFHSVLKIHGREGTVKPLPSPHILETHDRCNSPKLIPGKTYFFDGFNVFADFEYDSILQSLYFIISKCSSQC